MKINKIEKSVKGDQVKLTSKVETHEGSARVWFAVNKVYEDYVSDETLDAFLIGLFVHAMKLNEDIYLDGPVSEKLYYNLTNNIVNIYTFLDPMFHEIKIFPEDFNGNLLNTDTQNVVTGFSGGIDSFSVLSDYYFNHNVPPHYKVTHLIYNNVGAHGSNASVFFHKRYYHLEKFAEEYELPFIKVNSNLYDIIDSSFLLSVLPRNVASVMVLQKMFSKYLYASGYTYGNFLTSDIYKIGYTEPLTHSLYSTESLDCIMVGSNYTRVEKTEQVAKLKPSYRHLYVCTDTTLENVRNCSVCFKCARTLLTLEILGLQHLYKEVFDINRFNRIKRAYIESLLYDKDPLGKEILVLAKEKNYPINKVSKFLGNKYIYPLAQNFRKKVPYGLRQNIKKIIRLNHVK